MTLADRNINVTVQRGLEGFEGRRNDVISVGEGGEGGQLVVYFGGDVQDLQSVMTAHRDNSRYTQYSLENTARLLAGTQASSSLPSLTSHLLITELHCRLGGTQWWP